MKNITFYFFIILFAFFVSIVGSVSAMQMAFSYKIRKVPAAPLVRPNISSPTGPRGWIAPLPLKLETASLRTTTLKKVFQQTILPWVSILRGTTIDSIVQGNKITQSLKNCSNSNVHDCLQNNLPTFLEEFRKGSNRPFPAVAIDCLSASSCLCALSPNDEYKAVHNGLELIISHYKNSAWHRLDSFRCDYQVTTLTFSPDSTLLGIGCKNGMLVIYDINQKQKAILKLTNFVDYYINKLSFSADNRFILVSSSGSKTYLVQYNQTEKENSLQEKEILDASYKTQAGFSPDGAYLAAQTFCDHVGKNIGIWQRNFNTNQWSVSTQIPVIETYERLVFSPDGTHLAASTNCQSEGSFMEKCRIDIWKKQEQKWVKIREIMMQGQLYDITFSAKTQSQDKPALLAYVYKSPYSDTFPRAKACIINIETGIEHINIPTAYWYSSIQLTQNHCVFDGKAYALWPPANYLWCSEALANVKEMFVEADGKIKELQALKHSVTLQNLPEPYKAHLTKLIDTEIKQLTFNEPRYSAYYPNKKLFYMEFV